MSATPPLDASAQQILRVLAQGTRTSMPLARLCKQLGLGASVVMRQLSQLGDQPLAGVAGPGWVQLQLDDGRWTATLTTAGRCVLATIDAALLTDPQGASDSLPEQAHRAASC